MKQTRDTVRNIILAMTGGIMLIIGLRFLLDLFSSSTNSFISAVRSISDIFITPFSGIVNNSFNNNFNVDAIVAFIIWLVIGFIITGLVTAVLYERIEDIVFNFVDAAFKLLELVIFLRIVFDFFLISASQGFVRVILDLTQWVNIGLIRTDILDNRINFDAIIVLVIVVIIDLLVESILSSAFYEGVSKRIIRKKYIRKVETSPKPNHTVNVTPPIQPQPVYVNVPQQIQQPQQITINVPVPEGMVRK